MLLIQSDVVVVVVVVVLSIISLGIAKFSPLLSSKSRATLAPDLYRLSEISLLFAAPLLIPRFSID